MRKLKTRTVLSTALIILLGSLAIGSLWARSGQGHIALAKHAESVPSLVHTEIPGNTGDPNSWLGVARSLIAFAVVLCLAVGTLVFALLHRTLRRIRQRRIREPARTPAEAVVLETDPDSGNTFHLTPTAGPLDGVETIEPGRVERVVSQPAPSWPPSCTAPCLRARILLAEDGRDNQRLISFMLNKAGAEVTLADNGREAVRLATEATARQESFDVILMDMQMPVMDGYQATALLRSLGYSGVIIALTAHAMPGDRDKCLAAGCDEYATKPIERTKLVELIQQHLNSAPCGA